MATFTDILPFPPKFRSARTTCAPCESAGASTGNTQHTCAGPTECARPHVHPPPAQHPTHNAAAHTTTYSSVVQQSSTATALARSSASRSATNSPPVSAWSQPISSTQRAISTGYLNEICRGLCAAGFGCVIPTTSGAAPNCARVPRILGSSDILGKPFF